MFKILPPSPRRKSSKELFYEAGPKCLWGRGGGDQREGEARKACSREQSAMSWAARRSAPWNPRGAAVRTATFITLG